MIVITTYGQTLFDIALKQYGCCEGVFWILKDNSGMSITDCPEAGTPILIRDNVEDIADTARRVKEHLDIHMIINNSLYLQDTSKDFDTIYFDNSYRT